MIKTTERDLIGRTSRRTPLERAGIVIVLSELELGGSERQALILAEYLVREQNASVQVWALQGKPGRVAEQCEKLGIPWRILRLPWFEGRYERTAGLVRLARALRRIKPDILFPYLIMPNTVCGLIWRWTGARASVWNQRDQGLGRLDQKVEGRAVRRTPYFLSNSEHGAAFLTGTLGAPPDRVRVIHNGVQLRSPQANRAEWRSRLAINENAVVACMVANLTHLKDHATLLRGWREVITSTEEARGSAVLLLAGGIDSSDNTSESLKALAHDLKLGESVRFLGPVEDITGLLSAVDLGVFSSRSESSPNGVLECMAASLPVAGTANPGVRMAVGPDGEQFLAPAEDADALADRILRLMRDPILRANIGKLNRLRIKTKFSRQRMCEETTAVIIEALENSRRRGFLDKRL